MSRKKIQIPALGPIILVLGGGGSKGAWTCGILQWMWEMIPNFKERIIGILGTSTGSLIGGLTGRAVNKADDSHFYELLNIYRTVQDGNIMNPRDKIAHQIGGVQGLLLSSILQGRDSLFDTTPLIGLIQDYMGPFDGLYGNADVGFCTTNMQTGLSEMWYGFDHEPGTMQDALVASASQPLLMNPVMIGGVQHCDGGLVDATPVRFAWRFHAKVPEATIICISPDKRVPKPAKEAEYSGIPDQLARTLDIMVGSVPDSDYMAMQAMQCERPFAGGCHWIEPTGHIGMEALRFKQPAMAKWVNRGFAQAAKKVAVVGGV